MKITGSVSADEIPAGQQLRSRGIWQGLVDRVLSDHRSGKVTVVDVDSWDEYTRLRNGTQAYWRKAGFRMNATLVARDNDAFTVYLELEEREDLKPTNLGRPRPRKVK